MHSKIWKKIFLNVKIIIIKCVKNNDSNVRFNKFKQKDYIQNRINQNMKVM